MWVGVYGARMAAMEKGHVKEGVLPGGDHPGCFSGGPHPTSLEAPCGWVSPGPAWQQWSKSMYREPPGGGRPCQPAHPPLASLR